MKRVSLYVGVMVVALAAASAAQANSAPIIVADAGVASKRFMSLDHARSGLPRGTAMRSDRLAMQQGFMRLDRAQLSPVRRQVALRAEPVITRPETQVDEKDDAAVLELFGAAEQAAAAPTPVSFGETMRGAIGKVAHAWPIASSIQQRLTSMYGTRKDPFHGKPAFHGGVDIAAATGTPVLASADGVVSIVTTGARFGKYVSVKHRDGTESSYGHLSAQSVREGQKVYQGQKLGEVGSTGRSTGPHLDYRIKKNGESFDPMMVLRAPGKLDVADNRRLR